MVYLILGLVIFFAIHIVRMLAPGFRDARLTAMGEGAWKGLYSLISLAGLALAVWGWMQYRPDAPQIYTPPSWGWHATALLVLVAFILNFAAYQPAGRITAILGHPFLLAIIFWSAGHLIANGDLASLILFGSFLIYAIWNRISVASRDEPTPVFVSYRGDIIAVAIGIIAYAVFVMWLHGWLFGVVPF